MANHDDFTAEEWVLLQNTLRAVTDAVSSAQPGGLIQEAIAVHWGWSDIEEKFAGNTFVHQLMETSPEKLRQRLEEEDPNLKRTAADLADIAVARCHEAMALLGRKGTAEDIENYRRVVLFLGERVAGAATEGGFFGFGGKPVSAAEAAVLRRIGEALGYTGETQTPQ